MATARSKPASDAGPARLEALAREYRPALTRFFRRRTRQSADVDDLVQEVLLRLAARGEVESIEKPEAYLMRAASNVWRDYQRRMKTHARDAHEEYREDWHAREDHGPVDVLEGRQSIETLLAILNELPGRTLQVLSYVAWKACVTKPWQEGSGCRSAPLRNT